MAEAKAKTGKKRGATSKVSRRQAIGGFAWLAVGLMAGLFVAFLVFLQTKKESPKKGESQVAKVEKTIEPSSPEEAPLAFDFYKKLPKMEVTVPESTAKKPAVAPQEPAAKREVPGKSSAAASTSAAYVLQVGSFKQYQDADRQKANLAMMGISSKIVAVTTEQNEKWHRVQVGPISDAGELNQMKKILNEHKIDVIMIKVRG